MAKEIICGIYIIKNLVNDKTYVGQSKDIYSRWDTHFCDFKHLRHNNIYFQRSWNKYGKDNFEFKIIEICNIESLNEREIYWVSYYNSYNPIFGYNLTLGGSQNYDFSEEFLQKMRESHESQAISIIQLDLDGNIINVWKYGAREASKKLNYHQSTIWKCINGLQPTYENFIWMEYEEYKEVGVDLNYYENNMRFKRIAQLTYHGKEIIKIWNNTSDIRASLGFDTCSITKVCRGKNASLYGFKWTYYVNYNNGKINDKTPTKKRVIQLSLNNEYIREHISYADAERNTEVGQNCIRNCCSGKTKTAGKFIWMNLEEYNIKYKYH